MTFRTFSGIFYESLLRLGVCVGQARLDTAGAVNSAPLSGRPKGGFAVQLRRWDRDMISTNLDVIWEVSAKIGPSDGCGRDTVPLAVER